MRILVRRPKNTRFAILREELVLFLEWNHCAAHICHDLERKTSHALERMESTGESEGLLWIEVSEECLYEDMIRLYSLKPIREALKNLEAHGVIVSAKERIGKAKRILYNYELVDSCVANGTTISQLPHVLDTGKIADDTGKIADVSPVILRENYRCGDPFNNKVLRNSIEEEVLTHAPLSSFDEEEDAESTDLYLLEKIHQKQIRETRKERRKAATREIKRMGGIDIRQRNADLAETARQRIAAQESAVTRAPTPSDRATVTPASPATVLNSTQQVVEIWNANFPDRAIDPAIYANGNSPAPLRDGTLLSQMPAVCSKVRFLIDNGAAVAFGDLVKPERGGGFRWQTILTGGLDWTAQPKPKTKQQAKEAMLAEEIRKTDEQLARFAAERARNSH